MFLTETHNVSTIGSMNSLTTEDFIKTGPHQTPKISTHNLGIPSLFFSLNKSFPELSAKFLKQRPGDHKPFIKNFYVI